MGVNSVPGEKRMRVGWKTLERLNVPLVERQLKRHESHLELISQLSQRLISLPVAETDAGIEYALAELGRGLGVDRCYLVLLDTLGERLTTRYDWVARPGLPSSPGQEPVFRYPWFWQRMRSPETLSVSALDQLPAEARWERESWQQLSIQSLLAVPLVAENGTCGCLGVDTIDQCRHWKATDLELVRVVADMVRGLLSRRQNREALQASDRRFSALADAAPALIWEIDALGQLRYGNRLWQEFTGWTPGHEVNAWNGYVYRDDLAAFTIKLDACLHEGRQFNLEARLKRADGVYRWMQVNGAPLKRDDEVGGMIATAFDITDHRMAKEQLLTMNESLEARVLERTAELQALNSEMRTLTRAVEQSPCSIVITDLSGRIEYVNPKFCELTGYSFEEAVGENPRVLKGEDGHTDYDLLWKTLTAGEEWRGEFHNRRKNGEFYWEIACISPIADKDGKVTNYLAVKEDITERKQLEDAILRERDELRRAKTELQQAYDELKATQSHLLQQEKMASIGQLAAGVAHEINNPVGFIKSNLATLGKYADRLRQFIELQAGILAVTASDEQAADLKAAGKKLKIDYLLDDIPELVTESIEGAERVKTIVQNLKSFSRVDQSEFGEADINECLESTINIVWNELKYKVTLERDYGELPPMRCYPQQLNQVFMNILVNGAQAIENKGEMTVATRVAGDFIEVRISDTGCGIPEEICQRIFEPFFTTKQVGKGTGLGMSISYDIVKKHGGDIAIDSKVGEGTTFIISLPLAGAPAADEDAAAETQP